MEIHLDMERFFSVNPVLGPFSVGVNGTHMGGIDRTVALMAIAVDSIHWGIAPMGF